MLSALLKKTILFVSVFVVGMNFVYSQCGLELVLVDACANSNNDEAYNEYFVFTAQSDIMASDVSISVSCPDGNVNSTTTMGVANTNGFVALMNTEMESVCGAGSGIFIDGTTGTIPAGAKVIAFNCPSPTTYLPSLIDFTGLCGSPNIYIIFGGSNCNTPFFKNNGGCTGCGCIRYIDIIIDGCLAEINYDITQMVDDDGAFISPGANPNSPVYEPSNGCWPTSPCTPPTLNSISITGCSSDLASYDLTQHNQSVFASSTAVYNWYLGDPASGGTIITSSSNYDLTNLTDDLYIVVTENGCSSTLMIPVTVLTLNATFSQSENEICAGECVDFDIAITGGTPNYDVNLIATFNSIPLNISESVPSVNFSVQVCVESGVNFSYDPGSNVLTLGADLASSLSFTLVSIENGGCTFDFNQTLSLTINDAPTANSPSPKFLCDDDGDGIVSVDLNNYNSEVNNDGSSTIAWFSDAGATIPASNPLLVSGAVTVYAVVSNANCSSQPVAMVINVTNGPDIDNPGPFEVCDEFTFPAITGTSLSIDVKYYDSPSGTGTSYNPADTYSTPGTTTFYIYDGDANCNDEETFTVTIEESPSIDPFNLVFVCDSFIVPDITGTNLSGSESFYYGSGGIGGILSSGDVIYNTTTIYAYDINGNCSDEQSLDITITESPEFIMPNEISECGSVILPIIDVNNSSSTPFYASTMNGGSPVYSAGDVINNTTTLYLIAENGSCMTSQEIQITIDDAASLTGLSNQTVCDSFELPPINVIPANNPSYYSEPNGNGTSYQPGQYITSSGTYYIYDEVAGNPACFVQDQFEVNLLSSPNAGTDQTLNVCRGSMIDVTNYISSDADTGGDLDDVNGTGQLAGTMLDLNTTLSSITITYNVGNSCGDDQATYVFQIVDQINAGDDNTLSICDKTSIPLANLFNGDLGGAYFDYTYMPIDDTLDLSINFGPTYTVNYIIDGGLDCPADTARVLINILPLPEFTSVNDLILCNPYTLPEISGDNLTGNQVYTTQINGMGDTLEVGTVITESQLIYVYDEQQCTGVDSFQITINEKYDYTEVISLCDNEKVTIGTTDYSLSNPSGKESLKTMNGCDSIIHVTIIPKLNDTTEIKQTLCFGQSIMVGTKVFDEKEPQGEVSFMPTQENKCDSIVLVDLTFSNASYNNDNVGTEICRTDTVLVNGKKYYFGNDTGADTLLTVSGCDSIINVQLAFYPEIEGSYTPTVCGNESIQYNGAFYDKDNPSGTAILKGQSVHGCDSVVQVNIIIDPIEEGEIAMSLCADEQFTYNGTVYDKTNVEGEEYVNFDNEGCDSLIHVKITPLEESTYVFDKVICQDEEHTINGTVYNKFNLTGTEVLEGQSVNGCDSIVEVNLTVDDDKIKLYTDFYCPDYEIEINGVIYNSSNPKGEEVINNGVNECDSVILIDMKFHTVTDGLIEEVICEGGTIQINGVEYSESNPSGAFVSKTSNGCDSTTLVKVSFEPATAEIEFDQADCDDQEASFTINEVSFAGSPYKIKKGDNPIEEIEIPSTFSTKEVGEYSFEIIGDNGCNLNAVYMINEIEQVENTLPSVVEISGGDSFQINVQLPEGATIVWTPSEGLSCSDCPNPIAKPSQTTQYSYVVVTDDMCEFTGSIEIRLLEKEVKIYVPNSFSPNGDGTNEVFGLYSTDDIVYDLLIFDRWGNRMATYEKLIANQKTGWDGRFKGEMVNTGIYVYLIRILDENEQTIVKDVLKGDIFLAR